MVRREVSISNYTMSVLSVSCLRVEDESTIPGGGVIQAADETLYVAVDPDNKAFYRLVCEYEHGSGAKLFLAKRSHDGMEILKEEDVQHSVTGGKVSHCHPLQLIKGISLAYGGTVRRRRRSACTYR